MVLKFIGGVDIGDGSDSSGDWGPYSWSGRITAIVAKHIEWIGWQAEIIEADWYYWMLVTENVCNRGFIGV